MRPLGRRTFSIGTDIIYLHFFSDGLERTAFGILGDHPAERINERHFANPDAMAKAATAPSFCQFLPLNGVLNPGGWFEQKNGVPMHFSRATVADDEHGKQKRVKKRPQRFLITAKEMNMKSRPGRQFIDEAAAGRLHKRFLAANMSVPGGFASVPSSYFKRVSGTIKGNIHDIRDFAFSC